MILHAAVTPHTPLLLQSFEKNLGEHLEQTRSAFKTLEGELYGFQIETLVVISLHQEHAPEAIPGINVADAFTASFSDFGDLTTYGPWSPDIFLADHLQRQLRKKHIPLQLFSASELSYGFSVPLILLDARKVLRVVPIHLPPTLSLKEAFLFGQELQETLMEHPHRIACCAAGDLSHPGASLSRSGELVNTALHESLQLTSASRLLSVREEDTRAEGSACLQLPLATLFGILDGFPLVSEEQSVESMRGVSYLTASLHIRGNL